MQSLGIVPCIMFSAFHLSDLVEVGHNENESACSVVRIPQGYVDYHDAVLCFNAFTHLNEPLIVL